MMRATPTGQAANFSSAFRSDRQKFSRARRKRSENEFPPRVARYESFADNDRGVTNKTILI